MRLDDTIISSYNIAKRKRLELQDQRKSEKQALKAANKLIRLSSASEAQHMLGSESEDPRGGLGHRDNGQMPDGPLRSWAASVTCRLQ